MILNIGYCTLTEENIKNQSKKKKKAFLVNLYTQPAHALQLHLWSG